MTGGSGHNRPIACEVRMSVSWQRSTPGSFSARFPPDTSLRPSTKDISIRQSDLLHAQADSGVKDVEPAARTSPDSARSPPRQVHNFSAADASAPVISA